MKDGGWYYLHTNGELIWRKFEPEADSPFVKKAWPVDPTDRLCAWKIILDGFFLGARVDRLKELAGKWGLAFEDSIKMLTRAPKDEVTDAMRGGLPSFVAHVLQITPEAYWMKVAAHWRLN